MPALVGPFLALAFTLLISGTDKLLRPSDAAEALRAARLVRADGPGAAPRSRRLGRLLGAGEFGVGLAAIVTPIVWSGSSVASAVAALAVGASFLGFAWFVTRLAATDDNASCGCFGSGAPPGPAHRLFNLGAGTVGLVIATVVMVTNQVPSISLVLDAGVGTSVATVVLLAAIVPIILIAPALLSDTDPRNVTDHNATVPAFTVTRPIGERR